MLVVHDIFLLYHWGHVYNLAGMTIEDVRRYEMKLQAETNSRVLDGLDLDTDKTEGEATPAPS